MNNKLAVSTLAFQNWELEDAIRACKDHGIDAMEIRMDFHSWSQLGLPDCVYEENLKKMQQQGISVSDLAASIKISGYDTGRLKEAERCARIANLLQCRGIRIMIGGKKDDREPEIDMDGLVRWLIEADEIMGRYGTQIWIETHGPFSSGRRNRELLDRYPFQNVRMIWDIIHPLEAGEQPEETLHYIGKDLVHVHIKDGEPKKGQAIGHWRYTRLGEGAIPITDIVNKLLEIGYQGYFSLEWESPWRQELRGEGYEIPEILRQYSGLMRTLL